MKTNQQTTTFNDIVEDVAEAIPGYRRIIFKIITIALVIGKGRKRISTVFADFSTLIIGTQLTRRRFYEFLGSPKIKWEEIIKIVIGKIGRRILTADRLILVADDTSYGKTGRKISGCQTHFDHASKLNSSKWLFGHCRVLIGVLIFIHGRWACLPFAQKLYLRIKENKEKKNKNQMTSADNSKIAIAGELINTLRRMLPFPALVACDSWFGTKTLLKALNMPDLPPVHILSRLRINSALYAVPEAPKPGKKGRKRKYGKRLPGLRELAAEYERNTIRVFIYGKERDVTYSEFICVSQALQCQIKVVLIHNNKTGKFFPVFTNDLTMDAKDMIEIYAARWKIESGFKEIKHEIGALDNQARKHHAVENHFNLCCLAATLTWIYAMDQKHAPHRRYPSLRSSTYSFADVREQIRNEYLKPIHFSGFCPEIVKRAGNLILKQFLRCAA
jgi:hypothetical protein